MIWSQVIHYQTIKIVLFVVKAAYVSHITPRDGSSWGGMRLTIHGDGEF